MAFGKWIAAAILALVPTLASAQSGPNWPLGYRPAPSEWQQWWTSKQNFLGVTASGAVCNGTTDDASAINSALSTVSSAGGGIVQIPPAVSCAIGSTINIPANVKLLGSGAGSSILKVLHAGMTAVNFTGNNSGMERLQINCGAAGNNLSGACVSFGANLAQILINDFILQSPYIGFSIISDVLITIENGYIYSPTSSSVPSVTGGGGRGIVINGGNNQQITNVFTEGASLTSQPYAAIEIQASGQVVLNNNQGLWTGNGMVVDPGAGQTVTWLFDNQSAYDTGTGTGIIIHPTGGGSVTGVYEIGTWTATMSGSGVLVTRDSSSTVDDIHFVGHRSYQNQDVGIDFENGARVFITGSSVCGNSASGTGAYAGIKMGASATFLNVTGTMSGACAGFGVTQDFGIEVDTGANHFTATGNNLYGNSTSPFGIAGPLAIAQISNNEGVDDQIVNVTGGTSFTFPANPILSLGGTGSFSTILGGWGGRRVLINPSSSFTLATGGNIGNSVTATAHVLIEGYFDGNLWYFH